MGAGTRIDHVQLAAPPGTEEEARGFFSGVLGMVEELKPEALRSRGGCWFSLGSCSIHVGIEDDFTPQRKAHPAFAVDRLESTAASLESAGFPVHWDTAIPGVRRFYTTDPWGNRLEFMSE